MLDNIDGILLDQKEEIELIFKGNRIIHRDVQKEELMKYLDRPNILALLGIRRSGKSTLAHLLMGDRKYGYVNFDDERFKGLDHDGLNAVLEAVYRIEGDIDHLVLDEIQNVDNWELFANRIRRTKKVIITGSNARLLSGDLATHLTGRYVPINLYPFSFREHLAMNGMKVKENYSTKERAAVKSLLNEYLSTGGLPEVALFGKRMARQIYGDIITKDIITRHDIRKDTTFGELARYLVSNTACEFTYSKLKRIFDIKRVETVKKYVEYLRSAYLVVILERYSPKMKEQIKAPRKIYCMDNGIVNAVGFRFQDSMGTMMENTVALELMRMRDHDRPDIDIFYWKDHSQREVDFVLKEGPKVVELIQVTFAEGYRDIRERELISLRASGERLGCCNLTVITSDHEGCKEGISYVPLWKWLLRPLA